jgi:hypothetical protein
VNGAKAGDFAFFNDPGDPTRRWSKQTAPIIGCTNIPGADTQKTPSSGTWCCDSASSNGVWASAFPEPDNPHQTNQYIVVTETARQCINDASGKGCDGRPVIKKACTHGGLP